MAGPRAWLRGAGAFWLAGSIAAACGGNEFSSSEPGSGATSGDDGAGATGGSSSGGSGATAGAANGGQGGSATAGSTATGGTGGSAGGSTTLCGSADDCNDNNPCTIDTCTEEGICERSPKCGGEEPYCCGGECGQCCSDADCSSEIECMIAECFAGFCTTRPGECIEEDEYCGPMGCMKRERCDIDDDCADSSGCTVDTCVDNLCQHSSCPDAAEPYCCPDGTCSECCSDSQCASIDDDPCTSNVCLDGACAAQARCEDDQYCCPNEAQTDAICGECCSAEHCPEDNVECTERACRLGVCYNDPNRDLCESDETCDPEYGCQGGAGCQDVSDCAPAGVCETVECHNEECRYADRSCSDGTQCCTDGPNQDTCAGCCSSSDCIEQGSGPYCCQDDDQCHECCSDLDCNDAAPAAAIPASGGTNGFPIPCRNAVCDPDSRTCKSISSACPNGTTCCPDGYCSGGGRECIGFPI